MMSLRLTLFPLRIFTNPWLKPETTSFLGIGGVRHKIMKPRFNLRIGTSGDEPQVPVQKYQGFNFYPRYPDQVDPPYDASKLFAVKRIRTLKKRPYWERRIVEGELGLADRRSVAIVKNMPATNAKLYEVKHLIEITPITFPNGLPADSKNGFLKENGEFIVYDKLLPAPESESIDQLEADVKAVRRRDVDGITLKKRLKTQWYSRW